MKSRKNSTSLGSRIETLTNALLILVIATTSTFGQGAAPNDVRYHMQKATQSREEKNYPAFLENMQAVIKLRPGQPAYMYNLACAYALNGKKEEAIALLTKLAMMGLIYPAAGDEDFESLKESEGFRRAITVFEANKKPIANSSEAFVVSQKGLITESIAYDPKTGRFFLGSVHKRKILSVDRKGMIADFSSNFDGLWSVMGMKVDVERRHLWVCTAAHPQMQNYELVENGRSAVFKYDLDSGKLLKKYQMKNQPRSHWFGDLVVSKRGDVYVSDSLATTIYLISRKKDEIETFVEDAPFVSLQGLDFSDDERQIFIADYSKGLFSVDLKTRRIRELISEKSTLVGLDGLYQYKNSLIAIQNGTRPHRIVRIGLTRDKNAITNIEVLEANNPLFDEPTLGVIVKGQFYYIANSQWRAITKSGDINPGFRLTDPIILKMSL